MTPELLEKTFHNLQAGNYQIESDRTDEYNCIAWAAYDQERWWWPSPDAYWPPGVPQTETLESFVKAFQALGYESCENHTLEPGYEKVAIYLDAKGSPTHMARQLRFGSWTSKLGEAWDINHQTLQGLEGDAYGQAVQYLKRTLEETL